MRRIFVFVWPALVLITGCEPESPPEAMKPLQSRVLLASGNVWSVAGKKKLGLITGAMLAENATLAVDRGGRALVRLSNGTRALLRGGSAARLGGNGIQLKKGELWADVPDDEESLATFKAGDATVSASDAGFDLAIHKGEARLYVARGLAVFTSNAGRVEVMSGERAQAKRGSPPQVSPMAFFDDWTGGMADRELNVGISGRGTGQIYGIDKARPGQPPMELQIASQHVSTFILDGIAHTTVDQRFFNPSSTPLEGWYWFTVPEGASVERFALEVDGMLVEGEMIERKTAARAYEEAATRSFDPALLEWVDGRTFRARIFPIPKMGERRVVLSYTEILTMTDGVYRYVYPMGGRGEEKIQEFSLMVDLGDQAEAFDVATSLNARIEKSGSLITIRRSGYTPRSDFLLEMRKKEAIEPMRVVRYNTGEESADYVMLRYSPEVDWSKTGEVTGDVVVVLDTSAGGDASDRQIRSDAVAAILRALSKSDRFAVIATDLTSRVVFPDSGLAQADEAHVAAALEALAEIASGGASDLGEVFHTALDLVHDAEQPAVIYVGDGQATVGETTNDELVERLANPLPAVPYPVEPPPVRQQTVVSNTEKEDFLRRVERCKEYIVAGDIYQVQISQRFQRPTHAHPFSVYRALRTVNPSPYMYYLAMGDAYIIGASPEMLVRVEDGLVQTHPIAGTRRRGRDPEDERRMEEELTSDEKERAEHIMLVDLSRNDVGRIAQPGTVQATELLAVEKYSHVMHLVSHVVGRLRTPCTYRTGERECEHTVH